MTPKPCLPFIFILSSLPLLSVLFVCFFLSPPYCMHHSLTHSLTHSSTHFFHTSRPPSLTLTLTHSLTHPFIALTYTHAPTAQPLRVVTEDTCLFHYLVPAPMSPSNKSVGSDAGSQDSGDGNAGPRSVCVCERQRERERDGDCFAS